MSLAGFTPWPPEFAAKYRARGYWRDRTLGSVLAESASLRPDQTAVVDGDRRWTYRQLDEWTDQVAAGLSGRGIGHGDRVLVHLPNIAEFVSLCFALFRIGAVPVLALPPHRETEIVHLARLAEAVAYVVPDRHAGFDFRQLARTVKIQAPSVENVFVVGDAAEFTAFDELAAKESRADKDRAAEPSPDDVAVLLLSGGTTGLPKLIPRTHNDYDYNLRASAELCGVDESTRYLVALPAAHNFPLACPGLLGTIWAGGTVILCSSADPDTAFDLIAREKVTMTALVPPLASVWLDARGEFDDDLSSLQLMQVGGARLKAEVARRVRPELGCAPQQVYGMAEGLLNFTRLDDGDEIVHDSQGGPLADDDEIQIVDPEGRPVAPGEPGELLVRGPYTFRGYFRAEEYNANAFTPDGFYRSGDLVRRLETGQLVVEGRIKDVINRGGDKIPVEEVESLILRYPNVRDVAVVGIPDEVLGERSCAFVIARAEAPTRRDLVAHLTGLGVAAFKLPDRVRTVESFPRTNLGKVDRKTLTSWATQENHGRS